MKHASLLPLSEWKALCRRIRSHSREIERELSLSHAQLIEALQELGGLEEITRQSIFADGGAGAPAGPPVEAPIPAPAPPAAPGPARAPRAALAGPEFPVRYLTSKAEYRPALGNPTLIDALLQYHQEAHRRKPPRQASAGPKRFSPAELPEIEAELKSESHSRSRPGSSLPILRSKPAKG